MQTAPRPDTRTELGFTVLETLVALAIIGVAVVAVTMHGNGHPPQRRAAALALQGALAETRALAAANADLSSEAPTGATLSISLPAAGWTELAVYSSRPIAGSPPLTPDRGFPPLRLPVQMSIPGLTMPGKAFTIFVSSSGYASIAADYAYDPARPQFLTDDPGCDETHGVAIAIADDVATDAHPFACREARYDVDTSVPVAGTAS